jgi:hypothetical protein
MPTIIRLLPDALICVDESEADEYAACCEGRLLVHPQMSGLPKIRNWIHANVEADYIAHIDDDFRQVLSQVSVFGNKRKITRAEEITVLIENAVQTLIDLGSTAYCWSRTNNSTMARPELSSFGFDGPPLGSAFVVKRTAMKWDESLISRADVDYSLRVLLTDRHLICDKRFYWDVGAIFQGSGGNAGLVTDERRQEDKRRLLAKWAPHLSFEAASVGRKAGKLGSKAKSDGMSIRLSRRNPGAAK